MANVAFVRDPIQPAELTSRFKNPQAGAFVGFEGWVRDHHQGREVTALSYEAYELMAEKVIEEIIAEAKEHFDILEIQVVHRLGKLLVGDVSVWVGISGAHRAACFTASIHVMDELKHRAPIWKYETYLDGESEWVGCTCHHKSTHSYEEHKERR